MATLPTQTLTEDEYLAIERLAETKSEFHNGQMFAMAGGSFNHSLLAIRIGALLDRQVPPGCRVFSSDLRIHISPVRSYTYADCGILCGEPKFSADQSDNLLNPILLVEVLSPSSEAYDRGKKFELYRTLASLREYLLVHQDRRRVEHYSRQDDGSWLLREHSGDESSVAVSRLGVQIPLSDLYATTINCA